jgi:hypothetical protein
MRTTMKDDPNVARRAAAAELRENLQFMRAAGIPAELVFHDRDGDRDLSGCPDGDGEGVFIPFTIGSRGNLRAEAKRGAAMWAVRGAFLMSLVESAFAGSPPVAPDAPAGTGTSLLARCILEGGTAGGCGR